MWIFTSQGMISIVRHRDDSRLMMVRARQPEVLQALFSGYDLIVTPEADYHYRMEVTQHDLQVIIDQELEDLQYDNFKNSIADDAYHNACSKVWSVMYQYQAEQDQGKWEEPEPAPKPYNPLAEFLKQPGEQARQKRIARSQFPDDFGGCSDNYR